jgi:hypothetical protein
MNGIDRVVRRIVQATGIFQVLAGVAIWTGVGLRLIPLHMFVGVVFVLALWVLAIRALLRGTGRAIAAIAIVYGMAVVAFGMTQAQILPGAHHWVIRTFHMIVGFGAMGLADGIWRAMARRPQRSRVTEVSVA